jgi:hypothetical protein
MPRDWPTTSALTPGRLPARLDLPQTAQLLGFSEHDIPVLIRVRLLKPLGNPPPNGHKYFATVELERLAQDPNWLDKATRAVIQHWQGKNRYREGLSGLGSSDGRRVATTEISAP